MLPTKLLFIVSGEYPTLPKAEVKAILEGEGINYRVSGDYTQCLVVSLEESKVENAVKRVADRAAYTKRICLYLASAKPQLSDIKSVVSEVEIPKMSSAESFRVRVKRIKGASRHLRVLTLEREIGGVIKSKYGVKVNLENPEVEVYGVLTDNVFILGKTLKVINRGFLIARKADLRPFFHPSVMNAVLARAMVNLARVKPGDVVLDPFCGPGGILIEAGLMGLKVRGADISERMVKGARANLSFFGVEDFEIVCGDARKLDIRGVDAIVTDPPYGKLASTRDSEPRKLIDEFLDVVRDYVKPRGYVCMASPHWFNIEKMIVEHGYKLVESHRCYVHRGLTRKVVVFQNTPAGV